MERGLRQAFFSSKRCFSVIPAMFSLSTCAFPAAETWPLTGGMITEVGAEG